MKNGAGTRFLRPATAAERLRSAAAATRRRRPRRSPSAIITLEPLGARPLARARPAAFASHPASLTPRRRREAQCFRVQRANGGGQRYNPGLADYLLATNDFTDPVSRLPLTDADLVRRPTRHQRQRWRKG